MGLPNISIVEIVNIFFLLFRGLFVSRSNLILENLALRQQLTVQQRTIKRPILKNKDNRTTAGWWMFSWVMAQSLAMVSLILFLTACIVLWVRCI